MRNASTIETIVADAATSSGKRANQIPSNDPQPEKFNPKMPPQTQNRDTGLGSPLQSCSSLIIKFPVTTALSFLPVALANALIVNSELLITIGASYLVELAVGCDPSTV